MAEKIEDRGEITGEQINVLLRAVVELTSNGEAQLYILGFAFAAACRGIGVPDDGAHQVLRECLAQKFELIPNPIPGSDTHG